MSIRQSTTSADTSLERRQGDTRLLVVTLVLIAFCAPLALAFPHRPRELRYFKTEAIAYVLATWVPVAFTVLAACPAVLWLVRGGTTNRGRSVWKERLVTAFLISGLGHALVFFISLVLAGGKYGIH